MTPEQLLNADESYRIAATLDHAAFRANFDCRRYHGEPQYGWPIRDVVGHVNVVKYEPDPRCPGLVVWQTTEYGLMPGVRKGFTLDQVRAL